MALLSLLMLDPDEELWSQIDWRLVLEPAGEVITASSWIPSAEATLDGHVLIADEHDDQMTAIKITGGQLDTTYAWTHTIETVDARGRTSKRQRTIIHTVKEK